MRHAVAGRRLGRRSEHRMSLYRNLVAALLTYERVKTTEAKAKEIRKFAEQVISRARSGTLADRRHVLAFVRDEDAVHKAFDELGPRFAARPGGYTRLTKLVARKGDAAPMALLELVP